MDNLVTENIKLVYKIAQGSRRRALRVGLTIDDVISAGCEGLVTAAQRYDKSGEFSTYAYPYIKGYIGRLFKEWGLRGGRLPLTFHESLSKVAKIDGWQELTDEELAKVIGRTAETARDFRRWFISRKGLSLEEQFTNDDESDSLHNVLGTETDFSEYDVKDFLQTLEKRERYIVTRLMEGGRMSEISRELNLSRERVRQIKINDIRPKALKYFMKE